MDRKSPAPLQQIRTLYERGTLGGLTDAQLVDHFLEKTGADAEDAFSALVDRYGPMVWGVCRRMLPGVHDAEDAFQATFVILARRAATIVRREQLANWLYSVAIHSAKEARRRDVRRKARERRVIPMNPAESPAPDDRGELIALLDEELHRLPERFAAALRLCELEGLSRRDAAERLGLAEGTLSSRLSRGRDMLRARLVRRGVTLSTGALTAVLSPSAADAMPETLARSTVLLAVRDAAGGAVSTTATALAEAVLRTMLLTKLTVAAVPLALAVGLVATGAGVLARPVENEARTSAPVIQVAAKPPVPVIQVAAKAPAPKKEVPAQAWRRTDQYIPPNFEEFFPDDPEGGRKLNALWAAENHDERPDEEILRTVRQGMRRTTVRPLYFMRWIGNKYIWGKSPQNPDAIEIMYHATAIPGQTAAYQETRHWGVYFGLSVVEPKTPAILRTLADICMRVDDPNDLERIAWGTQSQRAEILSYLKRDLTAKDEATREKAKVVSKILSGELKAFEWAKERAKKLALEKFTDRLPEIKKLLRDGNSRERREVLEIIFQGDVALIMDDSFIAAFAEAAKDPDESVRRQVAVIALNRWIWSAPKQNPEAIALALRLSHDKVWQIRYDAVYYGLSTVREKRGEVIRRLLDIALVDREGNIYGRIQWGLTSDQIAVAKTLDEIIRGKDPVRARAAHEIYRDMTGRTPPGEVNRVARVTPYALALHRLHEHLWRVYPNFQRKGIDWDQVGRELLPRAGEVKTEEEFGLLVEELVARLEDSHAVVIPGSARPPMPEIPRWQPGFACLIDDRGRPVVYTVEPSSPAESAGIKPGHAIVSVNQVPAPKLIAQWMERLKKYFGYSSERVLNYDAVRGFIQQERQGAKLSLVLEDPEGRKSTVEVVADRQRGYTPRLPVPRQGISDTANVSWTKLDGQLGYLYVRRIPNGLEDALDRAIKELGDIKGLILDVRGNTGGGFNPDTAFQNFVASPDPVARAKRPRFVGPIALLIDEHCISAGEGWSSWFIANKRARLFGTTTAGASSRKQTYTLTNGLYRVVVPVKAYTGFLVRPIERMGLEPDVAVRCSAKDLAAGKDTVVETAVRWLVEEASKEPGEAPAPGPKN